MNCVEILTKNNCPNCEKLKMFMEYGLGNEYEDHIVLIHKEDNPKRYEELVSKHNIASVPALICMDDVLVGFSPSATQDFLESHVK